MYTATKIGESVDKKNRRRIITVKFSDGTTEFGKDFQFNLNMTVQEMKQRVKSYLDELNFVAPVIADGVIDVSDIEDEVPTPPTQAELDRQEWDNDLQKLRQAKELVDLGVIPADQPKYVALVNKVKAGLEASYIG